VRPDPTGNFFVARLGLSKALLAAVAGSEVGVVAGASDADPSNRSISLATEAMQGRYG